MSSLERLTPAERRLAILLLCLSLLGYAARGARRLSPEVEVWLAGGGEPGPAPPSPEAAVPGPEAGPRILDSPPPDPAGSPVPVRGVAGPQASAGQPEPVDPNRAGRDLLMTLPGVGPVLAGRILEDRERRGPYRGPEDLLRVPGIGPATLARLRPFLHFPSPSGGSIEPGG